LAHPLQCARGMPWRLLLFLLLAALSSATTSIAHADAPPDRPRLQTRVGRERPAVAPAREAIEAARETAARGGAKPPPVRRGWTLRTRNERRLPFGELYLGGLLGEAGGALVGALLGALVAALVGCHEGQGWVQWRTCQAGFGYAATIGAMVGAPVGAGIGVTLTADGMGASAEWAEAIGGATLGWLPAGLIGAVGEALFAPDLTLTLLVTGVVGAALSPLVSTAFYVDDVRLPFRFAFAVRPTPGGAAVALTGTF